MYQRVVKRVLDVVGSGILLVLLSPVLLLVAMALWFSLGTPVMFRQVRPGFKGNPFVIFKFRTMTNETDAAGELLPDEQRATKIGNWVRGLSLDELPELFNVLRGDMSLVGPRPLFMRYLPLYSAEQARRHDVKPGITGWAQINGRNNLPWDQRLSMDVWYVDHVSFGLDLSILARTTWKVILRDGISQDGHFSAPDFCGTQKEGEVA